MGLNQRGRADSGTALALIASAESFSLVEVTIAIGLAVVSLLAIFALVPLGINTTQAAIEETAAANLARTVMSDLRLAPVPGCPSQLYRLNIPKAGDSTAGGALQTRFFAENGGIVSEAKQARYRVNLWLSPPPEASRLATAVRILVTWPAMADPDPAVAPKNYAGCFEAVSALNCN